MNDYMEQSWLRKVAIEWLEHQSSTKPTDKVYRDFVLQAKAALSGAKCPTTYCACFSNDGDVLSQWRAYADDGRGVAIGFASEFLSTIPHCRLGPVIYDKVTQEAIVKALVDKYKRSLSAGMTNEAIQKSVTRFYVELLEPCMYCKNPAFREEQEWRLLHSPAHKKTTGTGRRLKIAAGYRVRDGRLIRHLDVKFGRQPLSIVSLTLGPKNPIADDIDTLRSLLKDMKFSAVRILPSRATYR